MARLPVQYLGRYKPSPPSTKELHGQTVKRCSTAGACILPILRIQFYILCFPFQTEAKKEERNEEGQRQPLGAVHNEVRLNRVIRFRLSYIVFCENSFYFL